MATKPAASKPPQKSPDALPSDAALAKERQREAGLANLALAREKSAEVRSERAATKAEPPSKETLSLAALGLVKLLWLLASGAAYLAGGKLPELDDAELDEGSKEALALVQRFPGMTLVLAFVGFPVWLFRTVKKKFERKPAEGARA